MTATDTTDTTDRPKVTPPTTPVVADPTTTVPTVPTVPTDPAALAAYLTDAYRTTPDHGARLALAGDADVMTAVVATRDDDDHGADVVAAYATLMTADAWADPYADHRRRAGVLLATLADVLHDVPDDDVTDVVGSAVAAWTTADPAAVGRASVAIDPPAVRPATLTDTRRTPGRDRSAVVGMTFTYRGHTAKVTPAGRWVVTRDADGATIGDYGTPSPAAVAAQGGGNVNGWADAWVDADGHTPDDYARA